MIFELLKILKQTFRLVIYIEEFSIQEKTAVFKPSQFLFHIFHNIS